MLKRIVIAGMLIATSANAGPNIAWQTPGDYKPNPALAAEIGAFLIGQIIPLPTPFGGMIDQAARQFGEGGAPYRELPKPIMPGKISGH